MAKLTIDPSLRPEPARTVASAVDPEIVPQDDKAKYYLWLLLLGGVFVLGLVSLIAGMIVALNDGDAAPFFVLTTAVVTGALGLFAKSPLD